MELLGIEHPLVLSPMAGLGTPELAAAVCAAGGLGSLGCAGMAPQAACREIGNLRDLTDRPININFFCHEPAPVRPGRRAAWNDLLSAYYSELGLDTLAPLPDIQIPTFDEPLCEVVEKMRPEVVSFHFGLPVPSLLARVKAAGCLVLSSATTVAEAIWLERRGADAVIAQGIEAGGHRATFLDKGGIPDDASQAGVRALVPRIRQAVGLPVIAAGGLADASGILAALALGASGVQLGTAYLLCDEAATPALYRDAIRKARSGSTVLTNVFTGRLARALANRLTSEIGPVSDHIEQFPLPIAALAPLRRKAEEGGRTDFTGMWAGEGASMAREISAAELTGALAAETLDRLGKAFA